MHTARQLRWHFTHQPPSSLQARIVPLRVHPSLELYLRILSEIGFRPELRGRSQAICSKAHIDGPHRRMTLSPDDGNSRSFQSVDGGAWGSDDDAGDQPSGESQTAVLMPSLRGLAVPLMLLTQQFRTARSWAKAAFTKASDSD